MDEKEKGLLDFLSKFNPLTGDYRKETPLSVKTMKGATALTPLDSVVEIGKELKKEEPDYKKIGLLTAMEAAGAVAPIAKPVAMAVKSGKKGKTVKAYKLFVKGEDGKLYPLFVDADTEVPIGKTLKATFPEYRFQAKNGNFYVPSRGPKKAKGTGDMIEIPDQEARDMLIEAGFLPKGSKAKSIRAVAARPGWHAGDTPTAKHIGPEVTIDGKKYKIRGDNQVWAEVEMPDDVDWQGIANSRAVMKKDGTPNVKTAHITDELPFGGHYRYKTNANMEGEWLISGDMKVIRELDRDEVKQINKAAGREDLPTLEELQEKIGFASGGIVGENMYKGMDDYLMSEMDNDGQQGVDLNATGMARGGMMSEDIPDNTIGYDPVSGNEIPLGSTAENVRDDIPSMLSEGEIVVPADVVNYYGVKFFEDLRAEAKQGYAAMDADGRIGGQPIEEPPVMGADIDIELSMEDLESTEDMGQPESAFLGKFFSGLRESNKKAAQQSVRDRFEAAKERKSVDKVKQNAKNKKKKDKPKNNFEKLFGRDRDDKPATPPSKKGGNLDLRFGGNPMERGARKFGPKDEQPEAGEVEEAYTGENLRSGKSFGQRFMEGLGYNEGAYAQKGGFDMEAAMVNPVGDGTQPLLEMREYMNDVGHRIFITFINGVPQMAIPEGYYPVSEATTMQMNPTQASGGGGSDDSPEAVVAEPFNYDELTMDELQEEVSNVVKPSITIIDRIGKAVHSKQLIKEIDRRLANKEIPIYEREYLENLKIVTQNPNPSLLEQGLAKLTGKKLEEKNLPNLTGPTYDMLPNQYGVTEAYTPEINKASDAGSVTRPEVTTTELMPKDLMDQIQQASKEAADIAFGSDENRQTAVEQQYTPTPITRDEQRRKERQSTSQNLAGKSTRRKTGEARSATRGLSSKQKSGGAGLDTRFGISGLDKGGLASKKGKKKKSK